MNRPPQERLRRERVVAVSLLAAAAVSGCAATGNGSGSAPGSLTAAQAGAEYHAEASALPALPAGGTFPLPGFADKTGGIPDTYQAGVGRESADLQWACGWTAKLLTDSPRSPAFAADLKTLEGIRGFYVWRTQADTASQFDPYFDSAALGDTTGLTQYASANCAD